MEGLNALSNYVKTTLNLGSSLKEVDWGGNINPNYTSSRYMLMEVHWGGKLKPYSTSCGCMLMEVDWGGKLIDNSMVDWGTHETSSNHMTEFLLSEVDWGAHDSSFFFFLGNIDYDAKPMEFFAKGLWGELQQKMYSTPLLQHMTDYLDTTPTEDDAFKPKPIDPELDDSEQLTGESIEPYLSLVGQLQWLVTLGRLVIHGQPTPLFTFRSTRRQQQGIYGYVKKTNISNWVQSNYYLSEMLIKHWDLYKTLQWSPTCS